MKQPLERDVRELAAELGLNLHRWNDSFRHYRGYRVEIPWGECIQNTRTRYEMYTYLKGLQKRIENERS